MFLGVIHTPVPMGGMGPSIPKIVGTSYMLHTQYEKQQPNFAS